MWLPPTYLCISISLVYLSAATIYLLYLAASYFIVKSPRLESSGELNRFAIIVPAHDEELLVGNLCGSLSGINYPGSMYDIFIVADNCSDGTVEVCKRYKVNVIERSDASLTGKGYALSWGLQHIELKAYDAVFIVDADNVVDPDILNELNLLLNNGEIAIQCYNSVGNREDSWFTQILFVSRTNGNLLFHQAKYKLGLSSYLMGNGLCFTSQLLQQRGWEAFSSGEDWEYYAGLINDHIKIGFAVNARVYHQESMSLNQATSQRLRWSSGRFHVAKTLGLPLFFKGLRNRDWFTLDASLPLIFPNYSLHFNLTIITLFVCLFLPDTWLKSFFMAVGVAIVSVQALLFFVGICLAGSVWKVLKSLVHVPIFLVWKMVIDILTFTGIYKDNKWVRTDRHISSS